MKNINVCMTLVVLAGVLQRVHAQCSSTTSTNCSPECNNLCVFANDPNSCCSCVKTLSGNNRFFHVNDDLTIPSGGAQCGLSCNPGYYKDYTTVASYYVCNVCNTLCQLCTGGSNTQCTQCKSTSYKYNSTSCYLNSNTTSITYNNGQTASVANPCPDGTIGIYTTKTCVPCPTGCLKCAIYLQH